MANSEGEASYSELVKLMGYKDTYEFEAVNKPFHEKILTLKNQYGETLDENILTLAIKIVNTSDTPNLETDKIIAKVGPVQHPCPKYAVCNRLFSDCKASADSDWAAGTWECVTLGWLPPAWAHCQATVNLMYSGEMAECGYNYDSCCGNLK